MDLQDSVILELGNIEDGFVEGKEDIKAPNVPPRFHNSSLNSNPYLNHSSLKDSTGEQNNHSVESSDKAENPYLNSRNLSILNRNLRNITFLKSPNPLHGSKSRDRVLDLQALDFSSRIYSENPVGSWVKTENPKDNKRNLSRKSEHDKSFELYNLDMDTSIPFNSIINRSRGKIMQKNVTPYDQRMGPEVANSHNRDLFRINPTFKVEFGCAGSRRRTNALPPYEIIKKDKTSKELISNRTMNTENPWQNGGTRSIIFPPKNTGDMNWSSADQTQNRIELRKALSKNISRNSLCRKRSSHATADLKNNAQNLLSSHNISKSVLPGITPIAKATAKDECPRGRSQHKISKEQYVQESHPNDHHVLALLDNTDIANSDISARNFKWDRATSFHDG